MNEMIELPEKLDYSRAEWLYLALQQRRGSPVHLNGRDVRYFGALCAQILTAAARDWKTEGHKLSVDTSSAFLADMVLLGVDTLIPSKMVTE